MDVGKLTLELVKPEKLDEQLVAATGCSAAETYGLLEHSPIAAHIAAALVPFVKDCPPRHDLAQAIAEQGVAEVRAQVRELYRVELGIPEPEVPKHLRAPAKGGRRGKAED